MIVTNEIRQKIDMKNPLAYLTERMWHYAGDNRRNIVLYMLLFLGANIAISLEPLVVGIFLNAVQTEGVSMDNIERLLLLISQVFILEAVFWSMHGPARVIENRNAFRVRANYKNFLLGGAFGLPIEWHTNHHSGDTIDKIEKGTQAMFTFSSKTFELEQSVIALAVSLTALVIFSPAAAAAALTLSALTFLALTRFDKKLIPGYGIVNHYDNRISAKIFDALSNISTIIVLRAQNLVLKSLKKEIERPYRQYNTNIVTNEQKWFFASMMGRLVVVVTVAVYLVFNLQRGGMILAGTVFILYNYANRIRDVFYQFAYSYHDIVSYRAAVANAEELPVDFAKNPAGGRNRLPRDWAKMRIMGLSFAYPEQTKDAGFGLNGITIEAGRGEHIAIIGASGAGKSTLLKAMRDLYKPDLLVLEVDGQILAGGFTAVSDSISLISQEPEIFATTIRENVTLGVEHSDKTIRKYTDMAAFSQVVDHLPKGLESSVVEKGVNLSGGERQRLALARGLMAAEDKDILLLDEPTSSVDFHNELAIYENIFSDFGDKTVISALHRLYLLPMFDKIYFLKEGRVTAAGSFEDLKLNSKDFQSLWAKYTAKS